MTPTSATQERSEQATEKTAIRPFRVNVPDAELTEMRRRITATRILVNPDYGRRGSINLLQHWQSLFNERN